ncbi:MAG: hypothetical protein SFW65_04920 [Alphaproteobacteria bacterium]|nr:hypothetical protein [Alphaproteobacteria bacterium]
MKRNKRDTKVLKIAVHGSKEWRPPPPSRYEILVKAIFRKVSSIWRSKEEPVKTSEQQIADHTDNELNNKEQQNPSYSAEFLKALQRGPELNIDPRLTGLPDRLVASYYIARAFFADHYNCFSYRRDAFIAECEADRDSHIELYKLKHIDAINPSSTAQEDIRVLRLAWHELKLNIYKVNSEYYELKSRLHGKPYVKDDPRLAYLPQHMIELFNNGLELSEERPMTRERAQEFRKLYAIYRSGYKRDVDNNLDNELFFAWYELSIRVDDAEDEYTALSKLPPPLSSDTPESEYPQPVWDLFHKAFKLWRDKDKAEQPLTDADVKAILHLYEQTGFTSVPRTWAELLAHVYESENHSFTDHGKARELRVKATFHPSGATQAYNLAMGYLQPPLGGDIDLPRALYWLARSETFIDAARSHAARVIGYYNELTQLRPHLPTLVDGIEYDLNDPEDLRTESGHFLARAYNTGLYGKPIDQQKAQAYYHAVATRDVNSSPNIAPEILKSAKREAALAAATRSLLGIGTAFDPAAATEYADLLYNDCNPEDISQAYERRAALRVRDLAQAMSDPLNRKQTQDALALVKHITARRMSPEQLVTSIKSGAFSDLDLIEGCLSLLNAYLEDECIGYPSYGSCVAQAQIGLLGHTQIHPVQNWFRYNAVDAAQRPILGAIQPQSQESKPLQGFGRFRGLSVSEAGEINFAFDPISSKQLPLIVPEDIEVALALAFGADKPVWPTFSAEPPAPLTQSSPNWIPFTAQWEPKWLGHTALGNTLFATDCEAGPLLLCQTGSIQVTDDQETSPSLARLKSIIAKMAEAGRDSGGHNNFLTFKVAAVEITWSKTEQSTLRCTVEKAVVGLQTGTIDENDTRTYTNNKDFATGYRAALFNANYDLFAEHYPLLERYRQLATLVTALNQLRERGFEPAPPIRSAIAESYNSYVRRPAPVQASQLFY